VEIKPANSLNTWMSTISVEQEAGGSFTRIRPYKHVAKITAWQANKS